MGEARGGQRADLFDSTMRMQGQHLVRVDSAAAAAGAAWLGVADELAAAAVIASLMARSPLFSSFKASFRPKVKSILDRVRMLAAGSLERALISEIGETDRATRNTLREGMPSPGILRAREAEIPADADVPGTAGFEIRAQKANEISLRLGAPVFSEEEARSLAFKRFKGAKWETRLKRLARDTAEGVLTDVSRAVSEGWSSYDLEREIRNRVGGDEVRARMIARTELSRVANTAKMRSFGEFQDVISGYEWVAAWEGTCAECGGFDGRIFTSADLPAIPIHPNCACTTSPVTRTWRELGIDMAEIEPPGRILAGHRHAPKRMTWRTWIRQQPAAYQKQVLGPGQYSLLSQGKVSIEQLRKPGGGIRPLRSLKKLAV